MSLPALDNLVRIGQLKAEPCNMAEVRRMLVMAQIRLVDARLASLSAEGRFTSVYNAAHALHCVGTAIAVKTVLRCFNASRTRSVGQLHNGGCWMQPTKNATWRSTRAIWK